MKSFTLSLIALVMSGCLVLCLLGPQPAEANNSPRCQLANSMLETYKSSNWNCFVQYEREFKTKMGKKRKTVHYEQFQIRETKYCILERKGGLCNKKCEDFTDPIRVNKVKCTHKKGFAPWGG